MSQPVTKYPLEAKSRTKGSPTYPKPMTATLASRVWILRSSSSSKTGASAGAAAASFRRGAKAALRVNVSGIDFLVIVGFSPVEATTDRSIAEVALLGWPRNAFAKAGVINASHRLDGPSMGEAPRGAYNGCMCGIVGYAGSKQAVPILLDGLK